MANEDWMTTLPEDIRILPIINLAIPGSHNSMTYGINSSSEIAPDAETTIRRIYRVLPWFVRRWARTQNATINEQLKLGIRYFDCRIAQKENMFYYTHGLFSMEILEPLEELKTFLDKHRDEVVILDFQHFYDMKVSHHIELQNLLLNFFGDRLYTMADGLLTECSLSRCSQMGRQVVLIYRRCPINIPKNFWPSYMFPTPWPNVASTTQLLNFLHKSLNSRNPQIGYVSQCVLTPTGRYIAFRFMSSLKSTAKKVDKKVQPWIESQMPGPFSDDDPPRVNIFIADFVDLKNGKFCDWVIELNTKLIKKSEKEEQS